MEQLNIILEWIRSGEAPDSFNDSFIKSVERSLEDFGRLTSRQIGALDNIIKKYRIEDN